MQLNLTKNDPWLQPFEAIIEGRHQDAIDKERDLIINAGSLDAFANAHHYFGLHQSPDGGWIFREWAPNATGITLIGDFSGWKQTERFALSRVPGRDRKSVV